MAYLSNNNDFISNQSSEIIIWDKDISQIFQKLHKNNNKSLSFHSQKQRKMLKINSRSFDVSEYKGQSIKQHIEKLMELSQEIITDKLQQQQERQRKINQIEIEFSEWADKKQSQIRQKLQKSGKIKEEHLNRIVKKCKDKDKYLGEKLKHHHIKKRESLKQAWRMTGQYNKHFEEEEDDKNMTKTKSMSNTKKISESQFLDKSKLTEDKKKQHQINAYGREDTMKSGQKLNKEGGQFAKARSRRASQNVRYLTEIDEPSQEKQIKRTNQKLKQAFSRFKTNLAEQQHLNIQQLGERLEKIEKSRNRRYELTHKKRQKPMFTHDPDEQRRNKMPKKSERVHSQSFVREKRVRDWSEVTKNKRDQFFQAHLQNGNNYLENSRLKFLKTTLAKKIALSTIQKKLYLQRLRH